MKKMRYIYLFVITMVLTSCNIGYTSSNNNGESTIIIINSIDK